MGFFKVFKRGKVPNELPELITDKIEQKEDNELEKSKEVVNNYLKQEEVSKEIKKEKQIGEVEKSFFSDLQNNLVKEIGNLNKLESWYNNKFLPQDIVLEMREYWKNQQDPPLMQVLGRNFKEKITERLNKLQGLEREWQNTYFDLVEKEEEIREQERELKKIMAEFVEVCKKRTKGYKKGKK